MTGRTAPHLDWVDGDMTLMDRHVDFAIVDAPFDRVFPLVAGLYRAARGDVAIIDGVSEHPERLKWGNPPDAYYYRAGGLDDRRWGRRQPPKYPVADRRFWSKSAPQEAFYTGDLMLVSTPHEAPHLTVLETDHIYLSPCYVTKAVSRMDISLTVYQFRSEKHVKTRCLDFFSALRRGEFLRDVEAGRGTKVKGWHFDQEGDPLPCEETSNYDRRYPRERMNRAILFDYARRCGLDLDQSIFGRRFQHSRLIAALSILDRTHFPEPTREYETERQLAIAVGYGSQAAAVSDRRTQWQDERDANAAHDAASDLYYKGMVHRMQRARSPEQVLELLEEYSPQFESIGDDWFDPSMILQTAHMHVLRQSTDHPATRTIEARLAATYRAKMADDPATLAMWLNGIQTMREGTDAMARLRAIGERFGRPLREAKTPAALVAAADDLYGAYAEAEQRYSFGKRPGSAYESALYLAYTRFEGSRAVATLEDRLRALGDTLGIRLTRGRVAKERKAAERRARKKQQKP